MINLLNSMKLSLHCSVAMLTTTLITKYLTHFNVFIIILRFLDIPKELTFIYKK